MASARKNTTLTRTTYRQIVYGFVGIGIVGLLAGVALGQHLAGTVVYMVGAWTGGAVAFLAPRWSDVPLQDERDYALHNRASGLLMLVVTVASIGVLPALFVLEAGGHVELSGATTGVVWAVVALYALYAVCYGITERR